MALSKVSKILIPINGSKFSVRATYAAAIHLARRIYSDGDTEKVPVTEVLHNRL